MHENENYALIMLDVNSPNPEIKLEAINRINSLEDKIKYIPALKKLAKHKDPKISKIASESLQELGALGNTSVTCSSEKDTYFEGLLRKNLPTKEFQIFEPYFKRNISPGKKMHIPGDIREQIQRFLTSENTVNKLNALFLLVLIPFEYKFKVTILVELLRDSSPFVVSNTLEHLTSLDNEVVKKVIPIIVSKFSEDNKLITELVEEYLLRLDPKTFKEELDTLKETGPSMKILKSISEKLRNTLN